MQHSTFTRRVREARVPTRWVAHGLAAIRSVRAGLAASLSTLIAGCVLAPRGLHEERAQVDRAGANYAVPIEKRALPDIGSDASWRDLLARAFAANGALESSYFEWSAALERVTEAAGYPNTNIAPSFSYLLSGSGMKAWDRTTVNVGFDPMQNLSLPSKVRKAGEVAFARAKEAGRKFVATKFSLQRELLDEWLDLALLDEELRIQIERSDLAKLFAANAAQRAGLSGDQRDLLRAQIEQQRAELNLAELRSRKNASRAKLNGLLARDPDASLPESFSLPEPRPVHGDDAALIAAGVANSPELEALAFAVEDRDRSLELARLQYLPDFNPFVSFTGGVQQMLGVGVSLPTRLPQIRAGVAEARAMLQEARAQLHQATLDRRASFVAALTMLRFAERDAAFLTDAVEPAARQVAASSEQAYSTGSAKFSELIESQQALIDLRLTIAEARIERERRLAEIEEIAGLDVETLAPRVADVSAAPEVSRHD